jgi:CHAT domain-containing protein
LRASDVATLRLNADWVILSACNTAASDGTPDAEGLSGLAQSFFLAGARDLLVSYWEVESEATVRLMTGTVKRLAADRTMSKSEALRRSMLDMIHGKEVELRHPAFWAAFAVIGDGASGIQ